jgi:hypothetical protein
LFDCLPITLSAPFALPTHLDSYLAGTGNERTRCAFLRGQIILSRLRSVHTCSSVRTFPPAGSGISQAGRPSEYPKTPRLALAFRRIRMRLSTFKRCSVLFRHFFLPGMVSKTQRRFSARFTRIFLRLSKRPHAHRVQLELGGQHLPSTFPDYSLEILVRLSGSGYRGSGRLVRSTYRHSSCSPSTLVS